MSFITYVWVCVFLNASQTSQGLMCGTIILLFWIPDHNKIYGICDDGELAIKKSNWYKIGSQ